MFSRMPGYYIEEYDAQDFSSVELDTEPPRKVEGRYWKIAYWLKEGARKVGPVQIARNYTDLMLKRGGKKLVDDVDANGGTAIAQMPIGGKNIYLQVYVSNSGDVYELTVVEEAAMEQKVEFTAMELARALNDHGLGRAAQHPVRHGQGDAEARVGGGAGAGRRAAEERRDAQSRDPGAHRQRRPGGREPEAVAGSRGGGQGRIWCRRSASPPPG